MTGPLSSSEYMGTMPRDATGLSRIDETRTNTSVPEWGDMSYTDRSYTVMSYTDVSYTGMSSTDKSCTDMSYTYMSYTRFHYMRFSKKKKDAHMGFTASSIFFEFMYAYRFF